MQSFQRETRKLKEEDKLLDEEKLRTTNLLQDKKQLEL